MKEEILGLLEEIDSKKAEIVERTPCSYEDYLLPQDQELTSLKLPQ